MAQKSEAWTVPIFYQVQPSWGWAWGSHIAGLGLACFEHHCATVQFQRTAIVHSHCPAFLASSLGWAEQPTRSPVTGQVLNLCFTSCWPRPRNECRLWGTAKASRVA
jgi:hypothetical protein